MHDYFKLPLLLALLALLPVANGQDISAEDAIRNTVVTDRPVHFRGTDGQDIVVDAGVYWVTPAEESLELLRLADGTNYTVRATASELEESPEESMAVSTPGTEEQPDTHSIAYLRSNGTQLVAEGSYSGIEARGVLGDAARRKAAQARANAQRAAAAAKRRAQAAAAAVRQKKEELARQVRAGARRDLARMLREISEAEEKQGRKASLALTARYAPRLAAASTASLAPQQRRAIMQAGLRELRAQMPFIQEVARRMATVPNLIRDGRDRLSDAELARVKDAIIGSGPNELQLPFANRAVTARGLGDGFGPSFTVGAGIDLALVGGISIGASQSFSLRPGNPGSCTYISASADGGVQEEAEGNASVGFYSAAHDGLGGAPGGWLGGLELSVNLGASATGGAEVVLLFGIPDESLAYFPLTGIQVGASGGEGAEATVGLGYGIRVLCL